jgi:hypothetical protein
MRSAVSAWWRIVGLACVCWSLAACGDDAESPNSAADATEGDAADAGVLDAAPDVAAPDVAAPDATLPDAPSVHTVVAVSPDSGSGAGRFSVSIEGTGFGGRCTTRFGEVAALTTNFVTTELLDVIVPPSDAVGPVDVTVRCDSREVTLAGGFTYVAPVTPLITSVEPLVGRSAGGEVVTIRGSDLVEGTRNLVSFGGEPATSVTFVDDTTIEVVTPESAPSSVSIIVELGETRVPVTERFAFLDPMTVDAVAPVIGDARGGTEVTLTGTGLWPFADLEIQLGDVVVPPLSFVFEEDGTAVSFVAPPSDGVGVVDVTVTSALDAVTLDAAFSWIEPVAIASVAPDAVPATEGQRVTLAAGGADFDAGADPLEVRVGDATAFDLTWEGPRELSFLVPSVPADSYAIELRHGLQTVFSEDELVVYDLITVEALSVTAGPGAGGTRLDITGRGFVDEARVFFGEALGTEVAVNATGTLLSVTTPPGTGVVPVIVRSPFTFARLDDGFTYVD